MEEKKIQRKEAKQINSISSQLSGHHIHLCLVLAKCSNDVSFSYGEYGIWNMEYGMERLVAGMLKCINFCQNIHNNKKIPCATGWGSLPVANQ